MWSTMCTCTSSPTISPWQPPRAWKWQGWVWSTYGAMET